MKRVRNFAMLSMLVLIGPCLLKTEFALCQSKAAEAQPGKIKRLILKDGSYESISQYAIQGDRVRYFSTERNNWEELPYSMIDWAATEKYAAEAARAASERIGEALDRASKERSEEEARRPLVATGVRLPSDGVFLLDVYQNKPELVPLTQSGADLNKNTGGNILRGAINPIAGPRQTVELKGLHARIQSHVAEPAFFFAIDPNDPMMGYTSKTAKDHLRIVRCEAKKENRIVMSINIAIYGKVKQKSEDIEARIEPLSDYWVKVTPASPLPQGEYALAEWDDKGAMNQFVWDFGMDPAAPPNPSIAGSEPKAKEPVLIQKPKKKGNP